MLPLMSRRIQKWGGGKQGGADDDGVGGDVGGADEDAVRRQTSGEERVGGTVLPATASLTDLEIRINNNHVFHNFETLNTRVHSCAVCGCRILQFVMEVHQHETHEMHVQEDGDNGRV